MSNKQKNDRGQGFVQGAMILSVSLIIVKLLGFIYKVILQNIIEENGMAYHNAAYNMFAVILTIATAGLPVAIARVIASNTEQNNYKNIVKIKKIAIKICGTMGLLGTIATLILAYPSTRIKVNGNTFINEHAIYAVLTIAPAIFFICLMSAYRGYYKDRKSVV